MRTVCLFVLLCVSALSYGAKKYKLVEISTNLGNIKIRLYENTPRHSENFLKLVKAHHYDSLLFHRVIGDFMIQGGSSDSRHAPKETAVGMSNPGYTIEAEIRPEYRRRGQSGEKIVGGTVLSGSGEDIYGSGAGPDRKKKMAGGEKSVGGSVI